MRPPVWSRVFLTNGRVFGYFSNSSSGFTGWLRKLLLHFFHLFAFSFLALTDSKIWAQACQHDVPLSKVGKNTQTIQELSVFLQVWEGKPCLLQVQSVGLCGEGMVPSLARLSDQSWSMARHLCSDVKCKVVHQKYRCLQHVWRILIHFDTCLFLCSNLWGFLLSYSGRAGIKRLWRSLRWCVLRSTLTSTAKCLEPEMGQGIAVGPLLHLALASPASICAICIHLHNHILFCSGSRCA